MALRSLSCAQACSCLLCKYRSNGDIFAANCEYFVRLVELEQNSWTRGVCWECLELLRHAVWRASRRALFVLRAANFGNQWFLLPKGLIHIFFFRSCLAYFLASGVHACLEAWQKAGSLVGGEERGRKREVNVMRCTNVLVTIMLVTPVVRATVLGFSLAIRNECKNDRKNLSSLVLLFLCDFGR